MNLNVVNVVVFAIGGLLVFAAIKNQDPRDVVREALGQPALHTPDGKPPLGAPATPGGSGGSGFGSTPGGGAGGSSSGSWGANALAPVRPRNGQVIAS